MDILPLVGVTGKSVSLAPSVGVTLARNNLEEGNVSEPPDDRFETFDANEWFVDGR